MNRRELLTAVAGILAGSSLLPASEADPAKEAAIIPKYSAEERAEAMRFYDGNQWDPRVRHEREKNGRPCLVVNRIPGLVRERALANPELAAHDLEAIVVEVVREFRDRQVLSNYFYSAEVERIAVEIRDRFKVGTIAYRDYTENRCEVGTA